MISDNHFCWRNDMVRAGILILLLIIAGTVWCQAAPFTSHGNGTVTDGATGLMWQQADDNGEKTWQGALDYCNGLTLAGYNDWRLPNIKELWSIVDVSRFNPSIDPVFTGTDVSYYWSSTSSAVNPGDAWYVDYYDGAVYDNKKTSSSFSYVRCVR
jgi:hypothetical protein